MCNNIKLINTINNQIITVYRCNNIIYNSENMKSIKINNLSCFILKY